MELVVLVAFSSWLAPALGSAFGREVLASSADEDKDYDSAFHYDALENFDPEAELLESSQRKHFKPRPL